MQSDFTVLIYPDGGSISSRERLLAAASSYSGEPPERLAVGEAEGGKPYFPLLPELHFSVSHSGSFWACAFGAAPVGLDLQVHRGCEAEKLARRFFHPDETEYLRVRGFAEAEFFGLWAAKESYIKYTGRGLAEELRGFSALAMTAHPEIRRLDFLPGYSLCLCAYEISGASVMAM